MNLDYICVLYIVTPRCVSLIGESVWIYGRDGRLFPRKITYNFTTRGQLTRKRPGLRRDLQIVQRVHQHLHLGRLAGPVATLQNYERAAFIHARTSNHDGRQLTKYM